MSIILAPAGTPVDTERPPYRVERLPHERFTARLNTHQITGPLTITPEPHQSKGFRASGLSTCLRQTGYRLLGIVQTDVTYVVDNQLAADQGTALHIRIQEQLVGAKMVYAHPDGGQPAIEVSLKDVTMPEDRARLDSWTFSGHIDVVLQDDNGDLSIFDLKTGKPELFQADYEYLPEKLQSYATQTHSYMAHFSAPDGRRATKAYVYMISRADTRVRALYRIPWQPERWVLDVARLDVASAAVQAGKLPPAEVGKDCRFCGWRRRCRQGKGDDD
jgi:hypothetical protein